MLCICKIGLFARRSKQADELPVRSVIQHVADQVPHVQVIRLANVTDGVKRASILNPSVGDSILIDEGGLGGSDELIVLGGDDGDLVTGLRNRGAVIQTLDGSTIGTNVVTSRATDKVENLADSSARGVAEGVGKVIDVSEGSGVSGRSDGRDLVDQVGDALELGDVEGLEGTLRVADEVDLGLAGLLGDFLNVGSDLRGTLVDGLETTDEGEAIVGTVGLGVGAVALALQPVLHEVQVLIVGGAQTVQEDDWVGVALAREVVDPGGDGGSGREGRESQTGERRHAVMYRMTVGRKTVGTMDANL